MRLAHSPRMSAPSFGAGCCGDRWHGHARSSSGTAGNHDTAGSGSGNPSCSRSGSTNIPQDGRLEGSGRKRISDDRRQQTSAEDSRLTILYIGKSVHERQPHQALRRRICHQHIQERVQQDLLLDANTQALTSEKTNSCWGMEGIRFTPAEGSTSAQSAPCSRRKDPRIRLWAASEPPGETDRTWRTS